MIYKKRCHHPYYKKVTTRLLVCSKCGKTKRVGAVEASLYEQLLDRSFLSGPFRECMQVRK